MSALRVVNGDGSGELRRRFTMPPPGAAAAPGCPEADRLRQAAAAELSPEELGAILDHVASCAACTVAWQVCRDPLPATVAKAAWQRPSLWAALAAALLLAAVMLPWRATWTPAPSTPVLRSVGSAGVQALVPDGALLPVDRFTLRWSQGPDGSRYTVRVMDEDLSPIAAARGLEAPEYTVPPAALADLPQRTRLLWQVETELPDGRRVLSPTWTVVVR